MECIRDSIRNKLLAITGTGTLFVIAGASWGFLETWIALGTLEATAAGAAVALSGKQAILWSLALMGAAIVAAFVSFLWLTHKYIVDPARNLATALSRLAGGDFVTPISGSTTDELGRVAASAEQIRRDLGRIIGEVQASAKRVAGEAERVSRSSSIVTQHTQDQSGSAATIAANVEQVTVSINSIAENTEAVRRQAVASLAQSQAGNEKLSGLVGEIDVAESAMRAIETVVTEFLQSTRSIIAMTKQVRDIAEQTNMLALNAAIEAARAGEQGRGFTVVADEVRKLAEKSAQSADQIDEVTHALSKKAERVDAAIETGRQSLRSSQDYMENVATVLSEANHLISDATQGVEAIAVSVKEQNAATHDISRNIEIIARKAEESCGVVFEAAGAVENLQALSGQLDQAVNRFRTEDGLGAGAVLQQFA